MLKKILGRYPKILEKYWDGWEKILGQMYSDRYAQK